MNAVKIRPNGAVDQSLVEGLHYPGSPRRMADILFEPPAISRVSCKANITGLKANLMTVLMMARGDRRWGSRHPRQPSGKLRSLGQVHVVHISARVRAKGRQTEKADIGFDYDVIRVQISDKKWRFINCSFTCQRGG